MVKSGRPKSFNLKPYRLPYHLTLHYTIYMLSKIPRDQRKKYEKYLAPGEELEYIGKIGDRYYWSMALSGIMIFGMLVPILPLAQRYNLMPLWAALPLTLSSLFGVWPLLKVLRLRHSLRYLFTNRRIIIKKGIFSLSVTTAPYDKITHIQIEQEFSQRLFYNSGTIIVHTAGPTPVEMALIHIEYPFAVKNLLEELIHQERKSLNAPVAQPWPNVSSNEVVTIE